MVINFSALLDVCKGRRSGERPDEKNPELVVGTQAAYTEVVRVGIHGPGPAVSLCHRDACVGMLDAGLIDQF